MKIKCIDSINNSYLQEGEIYEKIGENWCGNYKVRDVETGKTVPSFHTAKRFAIVNNEPEVTSPWQVGEIVETFGGDKYKIVAILNDARSYPIIGVLVDPNNTYLICWTLQGKFSLHCLPDNPNNIRPKELHLQINSPKDKVNFLVNSNGEVFINSVTKVNIDSLRAVIDAYDKSNFN